MKFTVAAHDDGKVKRRIVDKDLTIQAGHLAQRALPVARLNLDRLVDAQFHGHSIDSALCKGNKYLAIYYVDYQQITKAWDILNKNKVKR